LPTTYLRQVYLDTVVFTYQQLAYLINVFGPDRLMMGTDCPFEMAEFNPIGHIAGVHGMNEAALAQIAGGNGARVLGLDLCDVDSSGAHARRLKPWLLEWVRDRKRWYFEAAFCETRCNWKCAQFQLDELRTHDLTGNTDIRNAGLGAQRKWSRRTACKQPLICSERFGDPMFAPSFDGLGIGAKRFGKMIADPRRHKRVRIGNRH
jgi:hypothetical protein